MPECCEWYMQEEAIRRRARIAMSKIESANQALLEMKAQQKEQDRQSDAQVAGAMTCHTSHLQLWHKDFGTMP